MLRVRIRIDHWPAHVPILPWLFETLGVEFCVEGPGRWGAQGHGGWRYRLTDEVAQAYRLEVTADPSNPLFRDSEQSFCRFADFAAFFCDMAGRQGASCTTACAVSVR